jgi:hypothetical protein
LKNQPQHEMKPTLLRQASRLDELAGGMRSFAEEATDVAMCAETVGFKG